RTIHLLYVLVAASAVYVFAHWPALTNPYVINDDVRQQIFWMQQWQDPELYQNDLLTEYARNYVPWGVQAIYKAASPFMNPVQFTKILTGLLFVITAGFLFGIGLQFHDDLTAIFIGCTFCFMGHFMSKISGGLSQSFAFPLLATFLFFLGRKNLIGAGALVFLDSLFNPYIFLLCLVTYGIFLTYNLGKIIVPWLRSRGYLIAASQLATAPAQGDMQNTKEANLLSSLIRQLRASSIPPLIIVLSSLLVMAGCVLILLKYAFYSPPEFGPLATWGDMVGKLEYSATGRYELMPIPSLFYELIRPWIFNLPFLTWGPLPAWILAIAGITVIVFALIRGKWDIDLSGFSVFGYLFAASLLCYVASWVLIFKLFVPRRYVEFSLNIFYCVAIGACIRAALGTIVSRRIAFPLASTLFAGLAAISLYRTGIYDYSRDAALYGYVQSTPKTSLMAGPPDLMDNVLTFGRRKAFVTYKLSHTWYTRYWEVIKKRTFDFFRAYYAEDPAEVREFCRKNGIDYLVVRDEDFSPNLLKKAQIHFEPFDAYIKELYSSRSHFAVLDRKAFPPIYETDGIRVIKMR
ncbi:MAG: hypothetical protein ACLP5H_14220, partial [Desulfomonilaceae bacterium]